MRSKPLYTNRSIDTDQIQRTLSPKTSASTTHSKEYALTEREFELFLEGCRAIDDYRSLQSEFIAFVAGRLGLRSGEIVHIQESWVDWRKGMISISPHEPCTKGKDGGPCGSCKQSARQFVRHNSIDLEEARLELIKQGVVAAEMGAIANAELRASHEAYVAGEIADEQLEDRIETAFSLVESYDDPLALLDYLNEEANRIIDEYDVTYDQALERSWVPKTDAAARDVPFDHNPRAELVIERFFDQWDQWPHSQTAINRRVDLAAKRAPELSPSNVTPHGLRSTAASHMASRGLDILPLQSMLGWSDISTARHYVQSSGVNTQRALHAIHSR